MTQGITRTAAGAALIAVFSFGLGFTLGGNAQTSSIVSHLPLIGDGLDATPDDSANLSDFWKAWNVLSKNFIETQASTTLPSTDQKLWGAIGGLASSYKDPYTVYFPPEEAKKFQENIAGNFGGIGIEIDVRENMLTVVAPLKGTPAEAAGILAGDIIVAINNKPTEGISVDAAVGQIRGPKGTAVVLSIARDGALQDISVVRDTIQVPQIEEGLDEKSGVYHIALFEFTANSASLFGAAFENFKKSGSRLLVLDLRGNPGGYLESAVEIASHFLPKGAIVVTEDHGGKAENEEHRSYGDNDLPKGTKVVVLINQGSASASEILAGALKDHGIATLIGMRSFGKGSVQQLVELNKGSLKITVARWLTPSGTSISAGGLAPDITVERTLEEFKAKKDPQMERAVEFLTTGK